MYCVCRCLLQWSQNKMTFDPIKIVSNKIEQTIFLNPLCFYHNRPHSIHFSQLHNYSRFNIVQMCISFSLDKINIQLHCLEQVEIFSHKSNQHLLCSHEHVQKYQLRFNEKIFWSHNHTLHKGSKIYVQEITEANKQTKAASVNYVYP